MLVAPDCGSALFSNCHVAATNFPTTVSDQATPPPGVAPTRLAHGHRKQWRWSRCQLD